MNKELHEHEHHHHHDGDCCCGHDHEHDHHEHDHHEHHHVAENIPADHKTKVYTLKIWVVPTVPQRWRAGLTS